jgi:hypothetical protein
MRNVDRTYENSNLLNAYRAEKMKQQMKEEKYPKEELSNSFE